MPIGIEAFENGISVFGPNSQTTRQLGSRAVGAGYLERLTVPLSPGKSLWWSLNVEGNLNAYCYRARYVDSSLDQAPNQFTIQVDGPSWNQSQTGTAYIVWGEHVVGADSPGGNTPDTVADAVSLSNINVSTPNPTAVGTPRTFQITGINQPISLNIARVSNSVTGNINVNRTYVKTADSSSGPWTDVATFTGNQSIEFTVTNGKWVSLTFDIGTSAGLASTSYSLTVKNSTTPATITSFNVSAILDNDNNFNVAPNPDPNLDPLDWANCSFVTNDNIGAGSNAAKTISGVNQSVNIRFTITAVSHNFDGGDFYLYKNGVKTRGANGFGLGYWIDADVVNGDQIYFYYDGVTNMGRKTLSATITVTNQTTGATIDTFTISGVLDDNNDWNVAPTPDYTPNAISWVSHTINTNADYGESKQPPTTVSGINQPVTIQFTCSGHAQSGGTSYLDVWKNYTHQYRTTTGNGHWAHASFVNGDLLETNHSLQTASGRQTASYGVTVTNSTTGGTVMGSYNVSAGVGVASSSGNAPFSMTNLEAYDDGYGYASGIVVGPVMTANETLTISTSVPTGLAGSRTASFGISSDGGAPLGFSWGTNLAKSGTVNVLAGKTLNAWIDLNNLATVGLRTIGFTVTIKNAAGATLCTFNVFASANASGGIDV